MLKLLKSIKKSFKSQFNAQSYLGVDVGTASIKVVELSGSGSEIMLKNYGILESSGHLERMNNAIQTSSLKMLNDETARLIKTLLKEMRPGTTDAIASIPAFSAFTSLLDIPAMSSDETTQAMQYQAKQFVPLPLTEVIIDWIPAGEYEDKDGVKKQQIFLIAIPREQVQKYQDIFKTAGLNLRILEIETLSLARLLTAGDPTTTLIIDIGARSTAIAIAKNGILRYSSQTDFASASLTQAISRGLSINVHRAEDLKRQKGLTGSEGAYGISTLMLPYVDVTLNEVKRVKGTYENNYHDSVERIVLSGGGANVLGIEKYVSQQFSLPTVKAQPFSHISYPPDTAPFINTIGPSFAVALGLGMKQFGKK